MDMRWTPWWPTIRWCCWMEDIPVCDRIVRLCPVPHQCHHYLTMDNRTSTSTSRTMDITFTPPALISLRPCTRLFRGTQIPSSSINNSSRAARTAASMGPWTRSIPTTRSAGTWQWFKEGHHFILSWMRPIDCCDNSVDKWVGVCPCVGGREN